MTKLNKLKTSYTFRVILFGLLLTLPPLLSELGIMKNSTVRIFGHTVLIAVVALGLNLLLGYSRLVSLGTASFTGLGAYLFVYISNNVYDGFFVAAAITIVIVALFGALIGIISVRVEGIYLAIATLFIGEILLEIFKSVDWLTGGFSGAHTHHIKFNLIFTELTLTRNQNYLFIVLVLVIVMIAVYHLIHSRTGRALMAMSRSEHAAQAMGISVVKYRLIAFISATVLAAIGGILYASYYKHVYPDGWNLNLSLLIIAMVVVGGLKSIYGTVLGAFIIYAVPELYLKDIFSSNPQFSYIFAGILIIVVIMFYPYGAIYLGHDIKKLYYKYLYPFIKLRKEYNHERKRLTDPKELQDLNEKYKESRTLLRKQVFGKKAVKENE